MNDLKNKTIVITGGAEGIGANIAEKFLQKEANLIIILDINEDKGNQTVRELKTKYGDDKVVYIKCDVTKDLDAVFKKIVDTYKYVDVLVNNAAILDDRELRKTIDINVIAVMEWSFKFWNLMRTDKGGRGGTIINMSSNHGFRIKPYLPVYHGSKFAVFGFTKSLGYIDNFNRTGVRVIAICPGITETSMTVSIHHHTADEILNIGFEDHVKKLPWQKTDTIGNAAVEVFEKATSGTAWVVEANKPLNEV